MLLVLVGEVPIIIITTTTITNSTVFQATVPVYPLEVSTLARRTKSFGVCLGPVAMGRSVIWRLSAGPTV